MAAARTLLSASGTTGLMGSRRGGGVGSLGPWLTQNWCGVPEVGRGIGVDIFRLSLRQASANSSSRSLAGRTLAPLTTTTFLSDFPGDDIRMGDDLAADEFGER